MLPKVLTVLACGSLLRSGLPIRHTEQIPATIRTETTLVVDVGVEYGMKTSCPAFRRTPSYNPAIPLTPCTAAVYNSVSLFSVVSAVLCRCTYDTVKYDTGTPVLGSIPNIHNFFGHDM